MFHKTVLVGAALVSSLLVAAPLEHVTLLTQLPFVPGAVAMVGAKVYLSPISQTAGCVGDGVYAADPSKGTLTPVSKIACVKSLTNVAGKLVILARADDKAVFVTLGAQGEELSLEKGLPELAQHRPYISEKLYSLGRRLDAKGNGFKLMKSQPVGLFYHGETKQFTVLTEPPKELKSLTPFSVVTGLFGDFKKEIEAGTVILNAGENLEIYQPAPPARAYMVVRSVEKGTATFVVDALVGGAASQRFNDGTTVDNQKRRFEDLKQMVALPNGDSLLLDPGERTLIPETLWQFDAGRNEVAATDIPARDIRAMNSTDSGAVVARTTQIDWYGTPDTLPARGAWQTMSEKSWKTVEADCPAHQLQTGGSTTTISSRLTAKNGEVEMVPVLTAEGTTSAQCGPQSLAVLVTSFLPYSAPGHLAPKLAAVTRENGLATNVKAALRLMKPWEKGENLTVATQVKSPLLVVLSGNELTLVRSPFRDTALTSISKVATDEDGYLVNLASISTGKPYPSALYVKSDGTTRLVQSEIKDGGKK
jgi:hypothetical protein